MSPGWDPKCWTCKQVWLKQKGWASKNIQDHGSFLIFLKKIMTQNKSLMFSLRDLSAYPQLEISCFPPSQRKSTGVVAPERLISTELKYQISLLWFPFHPLSLGCLSRPIICTVNITYSNMFSCLFTFLLYHLPATLKNVINARIDDYHKIPTKAARAPKWIWECGLGAICCHLFPFS